MARERVGSPWRSKEEGSLLLGSLLWTIDRLAPLVRVFGVDFARFRELLRVRLLLALRTSTRSSSGASAMQAAGIVLTLLMAGLMGLFTGIAAIANESAATWILISQSVLVALLALMLFQVLAGILVDPTDIGVVAPHPVEDRTVFAVRLAEVGLFVALLTVGFTGGNVMLAVFRKPPLGVLFLFPLFSVLCAATTLGLIAMLFAFVLRMAGPARFQRVTLWTQILAGMLVFTSSQLVRLVRPEQLSLWGDQLERVRLLWPPYQYAELFTWATGASASFPLVALLAAVLAPFASLSFTFWLASRYFVAGLQGTLAAPVPHKRWPGGLVSGIGARLTRGAERASFDFAAALSRREPHFLRGVLPQLVMYQGMSIAMGAGRHRSLAMFIPLSAGFLFLALPNVLMLGQSSSSPDAGGMFASAPVADEGQLVRGGIKALLVQWIGLPAVLLFGVQLAIAGPGSLPKIVLALELCLAATLAFARFYQLRIPFTVPVRAGSSSSANLALVLVSGMAMGVLAGVHWVLSLHPISLAAGIAGAAVLLFVLWRGLGRIESAPEPRAPSWKKRED